MHQANDRNRFVWSLNPIFVWFRSIGIELDYSKVRSSPRHILMSMFAIGLFVLNLVISVMVIHEKINIENRKSTSTIRKIVIILSLVNVSILSVVPHFSFKATFHNNWKQLFETMQEIEWNFESNMFKTCRKITEIGVLYLIVVTALQLYSNFYFHFVYMY